MRQSFEAIKPDVKQAGLLAEVDRVIALCYAEPPDPSVDYELEQLRIVRSSLEKAAPKSEIADDIVIGAFAAKNIADWNPPLADVLMRLDFRLRQELTQSAERDKEVTSHPKTVAA
jgi:hypothetical protein